MNDPFGQDEILFRINGNVVEDKITMRAGEALNFGPRMKFAFQREALLEILEHEPVGEPDFIGQVTVRDTQAGTGIQTALLAASPGRYEFSYEILAE
jgi:hypothetical protein